MFLDFQWRPHHQRWQEKATTTIITRINGPDDASRVVWAIHECFFISCYFIILTTVIYSFSNGPIRQDPRHIRVLSPSTISPHLHLPLPFGRITVQPPPPRKHPRGLNDETQTTTVSVSFYIYIAFFFDLLTMFIDSTTKITITPPLACKCEFFCTNTYGAQTTVIKLLFGPNKNFLFV